METETQIAKIYLEDLEKYKKPDGRWHLINRTCYEHKRACQRFLEFLEGVNFDETSYEDKGENKITDLKNAIKVYEDAGLKETQGGR